MIPDASFTKRVLRIGVPASIEGTGRAISFNLLLVVIATFSTPIVAGYGIGTRIFSVVFLPAIALSQGVETMTGQNVGADNPNRAARTNHYASRVMFAVLTVMGVVTLVATEPIVSVFTADPAVIDAGVTFLRYVAPTFGFIGIMYAYTGGFRGTGRTLVAAAITILMLGVIRVPVAWAASDPFGSSGVWLAFAISNIAGAAIAYVWFQRGTWRDSSAINDRVGPGSVPNPSDD